MRIDRVDTRAALLLLPLVLACGEARTVVTSQVVDSAGITIVYTPVDTLQPVCPTEEDLRIGSVEGDSATQLFGAWAAIRLRDGSIAVLNRGTSQVKVFSPEGELVRQFGRQGGGPGEFRSNLFWALFLRADTLVVPDYRPWRFSFFRPDGTFIRSVELDPPIIERPDVAFPLPAGEGFLVENPDFPDLTGYEPVDRIVTLEAYSESGALVDTVGTFWFERMVYLDIERRMTGGPVFGAVAAIAHLAGGEIVYAPGRYRQLEIWSVDGALRRIIRWSGRDRSVSSRDTEEWRRQVRRDRESRFGRTPDVERSIAMRTGEHRPVADSFPAHDGLAVTDEGRIWVKEFRRPLDEGPDRWKVFERDGGFVCHVTVPRGMTLLDAGADFVLGLERDELDVEYVVRRRVGDPAPSARVPPS